MLRRTVNTSLRLCLWRRIGATLCQREVPRCQSYFGGKSSSDEELSPIVVENHATKLRWREITPRNLVWRVYYPKLDGGIPFSFTMYCRFSQCFVLHYLWIFSRRSSLWGVFSFLSMNCMDSHALFLIGIPSSFAMFFMHFNELYLWPRKTSWSDIFCEVHALFSLLLYLL